MPVQPALQSLPLGSVTDRADHTAARVSRLASSSSPMVPLAAGTTSLFTARMGSISLSRCSLRTVFPAPGAVA